MNTQVEVLKDNQVKLTVTVPASEVDARIKKTYKDFAHKYRFPGFRPGKAPRPVIDNALGDKVVVASVTESLVEEYYPLAVDANNVFTVGKPSFEPEDLMAEEGSDLVFSAIVSVVPEFELSNYEPVAIELPSEEVTEEELEEQIDKLREYYFDFKDCNAATKVKKGNFVEMTIKATDVNGNEMENMAVAGRMYEVGSGLFPKSFDEAIIGLKKGNEAEFECDLAAEESVLGQSMGKSAGVVKFNVVIDLIKAKITPELTDEWASGVMGFENVEDLKKNVRESLENQKKQIIPGMKEEKCLIALQERLQGEVSDAMCEEEERTMLQNFFTQLQQSGQNFDAYLASNNLSPEQFKEDVKKQARDVVEQDSALDAWARHFNYEVTDEDITREFEIYAPDEAAELEAQWRKEGRIHLLRRSVMRTRAVMEIMEQAQVTEKAFEAKKKPAAKKAAKKSEE